MIVVKRVYEQPAAGDGYRVLVDRLWPRGLSKEAARVDLWLKEVAPSNDLRRWYSHDPGKWSEFKDRYREELRGKGELLSAIARAEKEKGTVTLLFSSKEEILNNAAALRSFLTEGRGAL